MNGFQDRRIQENVNILRVEALELAISNHFGSLYVAATADFERGEVLADSRGEGSHQRFDDDDEWEDA